MISLSGLKDTDREILLRFSDKELIKTCSLNKYLFTSVCDDNFFRRKLALTYPDTLSSKPADMTYKQYYLKIVYYVAKMLEEFNYSYLSGNPKKQYRILHVGNRYKNKKHGLLIEASKGGELNIVKEAIRNGADIHLNDEQALGWASEYGNLDIVKYLVSLGADIHENDDIVLRFASKNGYLEVVKYLVNLGANIHAINDEALRLASRKGHVEVVKYLISLGGNIHANDEEVLIWAAYNGDLELVKYLVSLGANIHAQNEAGLRYASSNGHLEVVKYLSEL